MLKFSAGYLPVNNNFVIQNLDDSNKKCDSTYILLKNIFLRGVPTYPSEYLRKKFSYEYKEEQEYLISYLFRNVNWDYVIKGSDDSNPAVHFYNEILPLVVGRSTSKTFIAECPLADIVEFDDAKYESEYVDFYSPLINTVIEIDGEQHDTDNEQIVKDNKRDEILKLHKINIVRIKTSDLENIELIKSYFSEISYNEDCFNTLKNFHKLSIYEQKFLVAIRLELLLTELYRLGLLDSKEDAININICKDDELTYEDYLIIINDFYNWVELLFNFREIDFKKPKVNLTFIENEDELSKQEGINLYISVYDVYSQAKYPNVYYIRNDYFIYEDNLISESYNTKKVSTYAYKKNYYEAPSAPFIKYNLNEQKHGKYLIKLLKDISLIYKDFRENQLEIIITCLNKSSVIGILPTGAGKSLCYQISSLLIPKTTIVVAPLQLLMTDQYNNIRHKLGVTNITYINSNKPENFNLFRENKSLINIVSPERFFSEKFIRCLQEKRTDVGFVVIDEAHCLSEWGHDFRTSYLCLSHNLKKYFKNTIYLMALTGTASHRVFEDIDSEFKIFKEKPTKVVFAKNMRRDNLELLVINTNEKYKVMMNEIKDVLVSDKHQKTLIFTKKKRGAKGNYDSACINLYNKIISDLNDEYEMEDVPKLTYYVGGDDLTQTEKDSVLNEFLSGEKEVVLATKAFGMGVDIPDIRETIHYGIPSTIESLYQQVGRAGRDGKKSKCIIMFTPENKELENEFLSMPPISVEQMSKDFEKLNELQTNFFFIQSSNLDPDVELLVIEAIRNKIIELNKESNFTYDCEKFAEVLTDIDNKHLIDIIYRYDGFINYSNVQTLVEKCLYRLFLLGEIEMWGIVYSQQLSNPTFTNLKLTNLDEKQKLEKIENHIRKYESIFNFTGKNTFKNRADFLINWVKENYFLENIQSLKTLYDQCVHYQNSKVLMDFLANYFSNDPSFTRLTSVNATFKDWFYVLKEDPVVAKARLSRLLESYEKMTSLNYVSGVTRLRLNEYSDNDGERRLKLALNDLKYMALNDRWNLLSKTFRFLNKDQMQCFLETYFEVYPDELYKYYDSTKDEVCEKVIIMNFANNFIKVGDSIYDKL